MRLLTQDQETFQRDYPDAASFVLGARLRHEHYQLLCHRVVKWNKWKAHRLKELSDNPAITEDRDYQRMMVAGGFK